VAVEQGLVSPGRELERARAALMWERTRTLRDARLRANVRLTLSVLALAAAWPSPAHWLAWLAGPAR
jgi:hypothetical protein